MVGQGLKIRTNCKNLSVPPLHTTAHQCQSIQIFGTFHACILFWWKRREGFNELPLKINYFEINLCFRSPDISERKGHEANSACRFTVSFIFYDLYFQPRTQQLLSILCISLPILLGCETLKGKFE